MIQILSFNGTPAEQFEDYNELFECIIIIENLKLIAKCLDFSHLNWSFTVYSPKRVSSFRTAAKDAPDAVHEAYEENLPLIEICTGDFHNPLYIVVTPNVDMDFLKRQWCIDYCTFHHLLVREF
jgi:hypothetical protein